MSANNSLTTNILKLLFNNTAFANVGDSSGLQPSGAAGSLYVSLHTADPGIAGDQTTSEANYTPYARQPVARSGAGWTVNGNSVTNAATINFPKCTSGSSAVLFAGIGTAGSGTGTLLFSAPLGTFKGPFTAQDATETFTCEGHGLSVNDQIVFQSILGGTLPTGAVAGTVYYVKTAPDADTFTISATQGGATIDISSDGSGNLYKLSSLAVSQNITPQIAASNLTVTNG